jgi:hypothetical protein
MKQSLGARIAVVVGGALLVAACGSAGGLNTVPGTDGAGGAQAGGASGAGGRTTVGGAGDWGTTTVGGAGNWGTSTYDGAGGWAVTTTTSGGGWGETVGSGGYGGSDTTTTVGSGGYGGDMPRCIPWQTFACTCPSGQRGEKVCQVDGTFGPCICPNVDAGSWEQQELARLRRGIVGTWLGTQTNPWNNPGCATKIQFEANGHYSAHSPNDACVVFYYGSNDDSAEKTYQLDDVLANGEGHGEIEIWFSRGVTNRGELRHLFLSADENELRFETWKDMYGPLVFTLKRVGR